MKKPEFKVEYYDLIKTIQEEFRTQGKITPVRLRKYSNEIESRLKAYEEIYGDFLGKEWDEVFPGVPFSDNLLRQKIHEILEKEKTEYFEKLKTYLEKEERCRIISNFLFQRHAFRFAAVFLASFVTFPFLVYLFFTPNDLPYRIGGIGILCNIVILAAAFFKAFKE